MTPSLKLFFFALEIKALFESLDWFQTNYQIARNQKWNLSTGIDSFTISKEGAYKCNDDFKNKNLADTRCLF